MKRIIAFIIKYAYAAISCLYLFSVGFLFAKNRYLISKICAHYGYTEKSKKAIIPKLELSEIFPGDFSIQLPESVISGDRKTLLETIVMAKLTKLFNLNNIFEIGTFNGRTTLIMAANCTEKAKVYTLDLKKDKLNSTKYPILSVERKFVNKEIIGLKYLGTNYEKKIIQLYGDSMTFDFSPFYNKIDFIFIDGSHSYEYVLNDSKQALKLLRNGKGVILWHDYNTGWWGWEGVTRALNNLYSEASEFKNLKQIRGTSFAYLIID